VRAVAGSFGGSVRDVAPFVVVVAVFQLAVLRTSFPDLGATVVGLIAVVVGLTLFLRGLQLALFLIGETMAQGFARKGSVRWLLAFAFALGFGTTVAEPALLAVANEAARVRAETRDVEIGSYATGLRYTVAASVGTALVLGVVRILVGWPIHRIIIGGYVAVVALTPFAPKEIVGIAYDSGGVTTSTITVPLVTALGVGLSLSIRGRNPMIDGFGLIAFASLAPILFVLLRDGGGMTGSLLSIALDTLRDVAPIVAVLVFFQVVVLRRKVTDLRRLGLGLVYVVAGLTLFVFGLEEALLSVGRSMGEQLSSPSFLGIEEGETVAWWRYFWVFAFGATLGFSCAIAEPSLMAVGLKAEEISGGTVKAVGLRVAVAIGVGVSLVLSSIRIVTGVPLYVFMLAGYAVVVAQTALAPRTIVPLAYDSGGVTTSTVTVPLVTALGLGLASTVPGRDELVDGFGVVALAALFPLMTVMGYAQLSQLLAARAARRMTS